jgi:uncharacterized protein YndB with AHSA1/START domain
VSHQTIAIDVYVEADSRSIWRTLTDPDIIEIYWGGTRIESDWLPGSKVVYRRNGEVVDEHEVLQVQAPHLLTHTFKPISGPFKDEPASQVRIEIAEGGPVSRLRLIHDGFPADSKVYAACRVAWPMILCGLKTLLETGNALPEFRSIEQADFS